MMEILKSLAPEQLTIVLLVLGSLRETRLILKLILQYKLKKKELESQK